jgi:hypothetical protein
MPIKPQFIVTKLTTSGGHRHIFSRHGTLRAAKQFVKDHRLAEIGFYPRIYKRVC